MFSERFQELHKAVDYLTHAESGFLVIEVNDRISQNKCISFLETELASKKIVSVDLENTPEGMRPDNFIKSAAEDNPDIPIFCVLNMNGLAKGDREAEITLLRNFNMGREKLADLDKLLVFFFPSYFVDLILRYAGDFYDFAPLRITIPNPERLFMDRREYEPEFADEKYILNRVAFLKSRLDGDLEDEERFKVLMDLGDCYGKIYRWEEAIEVFEGAVGLAEEMGDSEQQCLSLLKYGDAVDSIYDYPLALQIFEKGLNVARSSNERVFVSAFLFNIGRVHAHLAGADVSMKFLNEALETISGLGELKGEAVILTEMARILVSKGKDDDALEIFEILLNSFRHSKDMVDYAIVLGEIANVHYRKGENDEALRMFNEQKKVWGGIGATRDYTISLGSIARILVDKGQLNEAIEIYEEQLAEFDRIGDERSRGVVLFDLAQVSISLSNRDAAKNYLEKANSISQEIGDVLGVSFCNRVLGQILFVEGKEEKGVLLVLEALKGFEQIGSVPEIEKTKKVIAKLQNQKSE